MKKRIFSIFMILVMALCLSTSTFAWSEIPLPNEINSDTLYETNIEIPAKGPQYQYKTEYLPDQIGTAGAYAAGQPSGGVYLTSPGDGMNYTLSGGASATCTIGVSLPAPYNYVSFSVNIGSYSGSTVTGNIITLGSRPAGYYKLYIEKSYNVSPYVVYRRPSGAAHSDEWEIYNVGATYEFISAYPQLIRVGG